MSNHTLSDRKLNGYSDIRIYPDSIPITFTVQKLQTGRRR